MRISLVALLALTLAACQPSSRTSEAVPDASVARAAKAESFARDYFGTFNRHEWDKLAAMYAPTAEFKDPSLGPGVVPQTREEFVKKYTGLAQTFPDVRDSVVAVYPAGEKHVVVEFVSSGTAPDGSKFTLPICTIFEIENGLITKDYTYYDNFEE